MNKSTILLLFIFLCSFSVLYAQDDIKALQYSGFNYQGSARSTAMGGAFSALGGDFSAVAFNPASVAVFKSSAFSITTSLGNYASEATYLNTKLDDNRVNLKIDELSAVFSFDLMNSDSRFLRGNFGIGYVKLADFNSNLRFRGVNYNNSIINYFENNANAGIYDQAYEGLAETAGLIIYDKEGEFFFSEMVDDQILHPAEYHVTQMKSVEERGNLGAFNISMGVNYSDKFYGGASLNIVSLYYKQEQEHSEYDPVDYDIMGFHSMSFKENTKVEGLGVNLQVGGIYVPTPALRIGLSVQTPTYMNIEEEWYNAISSTFDDGQSSNGDVESTVYSNQYDFTSPWRIHTGLALRVFNWGYLTFGHEYVNYQKGKYRDLSAEVEIYEDPNSLIEKKLHAVHNLSAGVEIRVNPLYFRAGYAFKADPYSEFDLNFDSRYDQHILSGGVGTRMGDMGIDVSTSYSVQNDRTYSLYQDNPEIVSYDQSKFRFAITFSTRF